MYDTHKRSAAISCLQDGKVYIAGFLAVRKRKRAWWPAALIGGALFMLLPEQALADPPRPIPAPAQDQTYAGCSYDPALLDQLLHFAGTPAESDRDDFADVDSDGDGNIVSHYIAVYNVNGGHALAGSGDTGAPIVCRAIPGIGAAPVAVAPDSAFQNIEFAVSAEGVPIPNSDDYPAGVTSVNVESNHAASVLRYSLNAVAPDAALDGVEDNRFCHTTEPVGAEGVDCILAKPR